MTVASERACDPLALLDEPFWRLLWHFYHLRERDERRMLLARLARVDAGYMTAFAFNQPDALTGEMEKVRSALEDLERGPAAIRPTADELRARGRALAARIAAGRVLADDALVS